MKNINKVTCICIAFMLVVLITASCSSVSKEDFLGSWTRSWKNEGTYYTMRIDVDEDGTYIMVLMSGASPTTGVGKYEIDGDTITFNGLDTNFDMKFKLENDKLVFTDDNSLILTRDE